MLRIKHRCYADRQAGATTVPQAVRPVLALHSSAATGGQWKSLAAALDGIAPVIAPDLPGYGRAAFRDGRRGEPASLAADAAAVLRTFGEGASAFHLVGHSYGGAVALRIALDHPTRVRSLTLIEPVLFHLLPLAGGVEDLKLYRGILGVRDRLRGAVAAGWPAHGMAAFVDFWNGAGSWDGIAVEQRQRLAGQARAVLDNFTAVLDESWPVTDVARLGCPLLTITGAQSQAVARQVTDRILDAVPAVTAARIFRAGHMSPLTHAATVNALIERHIRLAEAVEGPAARAPVFRRTSAAA
ncbi:alpha/beta fold hydrolase [Pelagibius sp. 7325]|uniref:alpha/beta fold hydrolase n=1 Tax=Pelagibius sp. 7325 TaxID=3131994 RepID=UPI0030EBD6BB